MSSPRKKSNPWGADTDFNAAFGSLAPFLEEVSMQPGFTRAELCDSDPFIKKMRGVDAILLRKRAMKKKAVLDQLQHETSVLFLNQKSEIVRLSTDLKRTLQMFLDYERKANIPMFKGSFALNLSRNNQSAIHRLLQCTDHIVTSSATISSSLKLNDNVVASVVSNLQQWHREMSEVAMYINTLLQFDSAFEHHCMEQSS